MNCMDKLAITGAVLFHLLTFSTDDVLGNELQIPQERKVLTGSIHGFFSSSDEEQHIQILTRKMSNTYKKIEVTVDGTVQATLPEPPYGSAEYLGYCVDSETGRTQLLFTQWAHFRGEPSYYTVVSFSGKTRETMLNLFEITRDDISLWIETVGPNRTFAKGPICQWQEMSDRFRRVQAGVDRIIDEQFRGDTLRIPVDYNARGSLPRQEYTWEAVFGENILAIQQEQLYEVELLDGDDDRELIMIGYSMDVGSQLNGESKGIVVSSSSDGLTFKPILEVHGLAYPYKGLCSPILQFNNQNIVRGLAALSGGVMCRYFPVVIDLDERTLRLSR